MTETTELAAPPLVVQATANERLAQLHATFEDAKSTYDSAKAALDAVKAAIKFELNQMAPEERQFELVGDGGPPLRLTYSTSETFDHTRLKTEDPALYLLLFRDRGYKKSSGRWTLSVAKGGE